MTGAASERFDRLKYLCLIVLYPICFDSGGIYRGHRSDLVFQGDSTILIERGGLVLPVSILFGLLFSAFILIRIIQGKVDFSKSRDLLISMAGFVAAPIVLGLFGSYISQSAVPILFAMQTLSGLTGCALGVWFIRYWRLDFVKACGILSAMYLVNMVVHVAWSYHLIGNLTFGRQIVFETPLWGVWQLLVYWTIIVAQVFLYALPYWRKKWVAIPIYLLVGYYIFFINVRTAVVFYFFGILIYFILFSEHRKITWVLAAICICVAGYLLITANPILRRFAGGGLGRRDEYWVETYHSIKESIRFLIYGTLFEGTIIPIRTGIDLDRSTGGSAHNQYLEFIRQGGLILFLAFFQLFIRMIYKMVKTARRIYRRNGDLMIFWPGVVIFVQVLVGMNANTPIRVTNPAVMIWFFWTGYYYHLMNRDEETHGVQAERISF